MKTLNDVNQTAERHHSKNATNRAYISGKNFCNIEGKNEIKGGEIIWMALDSKDATELRRIWGKA